MTFFQSENPEDPTWATPGEMLRDLGEGAQKHAGRGHGSKRARAQRSLTQVVHEEESTHPGLLVLSYFALYPPDPSM